MSVVSIRMILNKITKYQKFNKQQLKEIHDLIEAYGDECYNIGWDDCEFD